MTEQIQEILNFYKENKLVYIDREGKHTVDISDFCKQQTSDILQKTNRTEQVLLSLAEKNPTSLKWVNDYAMAKIIEWLKTFNDDATQQIIEQETTIQKLELELENNRQSKATVVLKDDYANLQDKYTALEEKFNKSVEAYKSLKAERDDLQNKLLATSQDMSHEYDELAVKYNELQELNISLAEKHSHEIRVNEDLQNQFDKLNTEYNDKVTELLQKDNQIKTLTEERDTALENEDVAIKQLESGVEKREKIINELKTQINKLNDDLNETQLLNNKSKEYIIDLENKLIEEQNKLKENAEKIESICNILSINNDTKHDEKPRQSSSNGMHRMGDNQVVNATFL